MMALAPVLHLNEREALAFTGKGTAEEAAVELARRSRNTVLITLGERGVYLWENGKGRVIPAEKAEVIDTIGAGDSHIGAVIALRQSGEGWEETLRAANRVSAMIVGVKGPALTEEEFEKGRKIDG